MQWYEKRRAGLCLRLAGIGMLGLASLSILLLRERALAGPPGSDPVAFLLAFLIFVCGSGGALLTIFGRHVFDRVEISRRWRHRD